jgi:hypothetical protein
MERDYPLVNIDGDFGPACCASIPTVLDALGECWMPQRRARDQYLGRHRKALDLLEWACPPLAEYAGRLLLGGET